MRKILWCPQSDHNIRDIPRNNDKATRFLYIIFFVGDKPYRISKYIAAEDFKTAWRIRVGLVGLSQIIDKKGSFLKMVAVKFWIISWITCKFIIDLAKINSLFDFTLFHIKYSE